MNIQQIFSLQAIDVFFFSPTQIVHNSCLFSPRGWLMFMSSNLVQFQYSQPLFLIVGFIPKCFLISSFLIPINVIVAVIEYQTSVISYLSIIQ